MYTHYGRSFTRGKNSFRNYQGILAGGKSTVFNPGLVRYAPGDKDKVDGMFDVWDYEGSPEGKKIEYTDNGADFLICALYGIAAQTNLKVITMKGNHSFKNEYNFKSTFSKVPEYYDILNLGIDWDTFLPNRDDNIISFSGVANSSGYNSVYSYLQLDFGENSEEMFVRSFYKSESDFGFSLLLTFSDTMMIYDYSRVANFGLFMQTKEDYDKFALASVGWTVLSAEEAPRVDLNWLKAIRSEALALKAEVESQRNSNRGNASLNKESIDISINFEELSTLLSLGR